jgi:hypothetical protein
MLWHFWTLVPPRGDGDPYPIAGWKLGDAGDIWV